MQIEFTGRKVVVTAKFRQQATEGLDRIEKMIGSKSSAHVILSEEKFRRFAEITVQCKICGNLTAKCESKEMERALHDAIDRIEKQTVKLTKKAVTKRRHPEQNAVGSVRLQTSDDEIASQPGIKANKQRAAKAVSTRKPVVRASGDGIIRVKDGVERNPMNLDQAMKAAAQSDRDVFIFRTEEGLASVLYRRADGYVELIEVA